MIDFLREVLSDRRVRFKVSVCMAEHIGDRARSSRTAWRSHQSTQRGRCSPSSRTAWAAGAGGRIAADQVSSTAESLFKDMTETRLDVPRHAEQVAAEAHTVIRLTAISAEKEPHSTLCALIVQEGLRDLGSCRRQPAVLLPRRSARSIAPRTTPTPHNCDAEGRAQEAEPRPTEYKNVLVSALGICKGPKVGDQRRTRTARGRHASC